MSCNRREMNNIAETLLVLLVMQSLNLGYFIEYMYHYKADQEKQIQHSICSRRVHIEMDMLDYLYLLAQKSI